MRAKVERITPEKAAEALGRNGHNRRLRQSLVERLAGAMRRGEWVVNGESVKFDERGSLIDGQHRFSAVIQSGKPTEFLVVRDLPRSAQETVDIGAARSLADTLALRKVEYSHWTATGVRFIWSYLNLGRITAGGTPQPTPQQLLKFVEDHPEVARSGRYAAAVYDAIGLNPSLSLGLHWLFAQADERAANEFFERFASGANLWEGHPVLTLRNQLLRRRGGSKEGVRTVSPTEKAAWIVKAFNVFQREGRTTSIKWIRKGKRREQFPRIDGFPDSLMAEGLGEEVQT